MSTVSNRVKDRVHFIANQCFGEFKKSNNKYTVLKNRIAKLRSFLVMAVYNIVPGYLLPPELLYMPRKMVEYGRK